MSRPALAAAAAVLAAAGLLTGCGSKSAAESPGRSDATPRATSRTTAAPDAAAQARQDLERRVAEHDRTYPEVAAGCAGRPTELPQATATAGSGGGPAPENPKYLENHSFQQTVPLNPMQQCRGEAHAARLTAALAKAAPPTGPQSAETLLRQLGYQDAKVTEYPTSLHFTLTVPGLGPCLTGVLSAPPQIEVHGPYQEGGCEFPRGGH
ncbi:hypothetical protein ACIQBJ_15370 [Kitasatospora sp. NPDC088391]|uniref:hypothetical protein n=1 Tax=Kitasatospora sp. NPDC088391 TaxID=3364074 RepID=UPI0038028F72